MLEFVLQVLDTICIFLLMVSWGFVVLSPFIRIQLPVDEDEENKLPQITALETEQTNFGVAAMIVARSISLSVATGVYLFMLKDFLN